MPLSAGARLGPYEILGPIGAGGMGEVYCARDTPFRVFGAEPRAGVAYVYGPILTPDGKGYAYGYGEWLQDLYLVEGLRF